MFLIQEYDVLDFFWVNLTDEDFEAKWEAIGWPHRIAQTVDKTMEMLAEETEKLYKIQIGDEQTLNDRIEMMTVAVTNLSGLRDFGRVGLANFSD